MLKKLGGFVPGVLFGVVLGGPVGFGLGVYFLPILTAESGLNRDAVDALSASATRSGRFVPDLPGLDALHWGDGTVMLNDRQIWLNGEISPGPDYRLYLVKDFVDDETGFLAIKGAALQVGLINAFRNFALDLPAGIDLDAYGAVVIWCEAFGQFITAARLEN